MQTIPVTVETSSQSETFSTVAPATGGYYPAYVLRGGAKKKSKKRTAKQRAGKKTKTRKSGKKRSSKRVSRKARK